MNTKLNTNENLEILGAFSKAVKELSQLLKPEFHVLPFKGESAIHFPALDLERQTNILNSLNRYVQLCREIIEAGQKISNDRVVLWRIISSLRLKPTGDLFDQIDDGDLIEIYDDRNIQIFRNFQFFRVCSYTLDDLLCRPWWELFRRDLNIINRIMKTAEKIYAQNMRHSISLDFGRHTVDEIDSPRRYHAVVENKILSPLIDNSGRVSAIVNVVKVHSCLPGDFPETFLGEKETASESPRQRY